MVKAQFGAGMAPRVLLVASSQAGPTLVAQQKVDRAQEGTLLGVPTYFV